jgi:hypothetical protein
MSRLFLFAVLLVGVASIARGQATRQPDEAAQREAKELKWAEGIALDFLEAAASGEISQAEALVGPALKEVHNYAGEPQRLREWLKNNIGIRQFGKPSIKSGERSPGGNEAVFRGEFTNADRVTPLTVRVAQDRGVWLVSFIRVLPSTTVVAAKSEEVREAAVRDVPARTAKRQTPAQRLFGEVPDKFHVYVLASFDGLGPEATQPLLTAQLEVLGFFWTVQVLILSGKGCTIRWLTAMGSNVGGAAACR